MARVYLSRDLQSGTGGIEVVTIDAARVHELIGALVAQFPNLKPESFSGLAVAIDGEIHNDADYLPLGPDSEVHFVPRIAGGCDVLSDISVRLHVDLERQH